MVLRIVKLLAAGIVSIIILTGFIFAYNYTGIHIDNPTRATDYRWEPNQYKANMIEGFSWMSMDADGFNNKTIVENPEVLLMGSSHMEAISVSQKENTGAILSHTISTYNIGTSGHTIYSCVNNFDAAVEKYDPKIVIIETDRILLDMDEMEKVVNNKYDIIPSYDSGVLYYLQKYIPPIKVIYKNIVDWGNAENGSKDSQGKTIVVDEKYCELLNHFLSFNKNVKVKVVIFYQPPTKISDSGSLIMQEDFEALEAFKMACEDNSIFFVDMSDPFYTLYEENGILAHGFCNTGVGEGHLNKYGHKVIADTLVAVLENEARDR